MTGDTIRFVLSRRLEELPVNGQQWNALVAQTAGASVFQTYEWFESWWTTLGGKNELFVVTMWDDQALLGIAPLMITRLTGLRRLEFTGTANADYQDFILGRRAAELLPLLGRHLFERRDAWDLIVLRNVPTESPTYTILPAAMRSLGLGVTDFERVSCPTLQISSRPAEVGKLLRSYSVRRRLKRLRQDGEVTFASCKTSDQIEHYLPLFFEQYQVRRRGSTAARSFHQPEMRAFYLALAKALLPRGWLHFSVLECGKRPVAFHFGFEFDGRLYWYKPCFDPAMARQSPGTVLLSFLIRDGLERGLAELDFTLGAEPFKYRYTSVERYNANLRIFKRRWQYSAALGVAWLRRTASQWYRPYRH
jgi:CelD/BcsL family acetyltransferase involved in cellulose biosynthesis